MASYTIDIVNLTYLFVAIAVNEQLFNLTELMEVVQSIKAIKGEN